MPAAKSFIVAGGKLTEGVFRIERNNPVMVDLSVVGVSEELDTKSTPSFPDVAMLVPSHLAVSATTFTGDVEVFSGQIAIRNGLSTDRFNLAAGGVLKEPVRNDKRGVEITFDGEFTGEVQYTEWTGATEGKLTWTWTGPLITGTTYYSLMIEANGLFTSRPPQVADAGPVRLATTFEAFMSGSTPDITIELVNSISSV